MRKIYAVLAGVVLGLAFNINAAPMQLSAQPVQSIGALQPAPPDSIVQLTAEAQGLALMAPADLPKYGTYWLVMPGIGGMAPLPCPPDDPSLPVYQIADGQFLVDATGGQVAVNSRRFGLQATSSTVASVLAAQADAVVNLINQVQAAQFNRELAAVMGFDEELDSPGTFSPMLAVYDTNALWLQIIAVTNHTASLVIHPPWNVTNEVYDLLYCTNLVPPSSWRWLLRTDPGQTNLTVANATDAQGFYRLGPPNDLTANDSLGTNFWLAFFHMDTLDGTPNLSLYISSPVGATGTVTTLGVIVNSPLLIVTNCGDASVEGPYVLTNLTAQEQTNWANNGSLDPAGASYVYDTHWVNYSGGNWLLFAYDSSTGVCTLLYSKSGVNLNGSAADWGVLDDTNGPPKPTTLCEQVPFSQTFSVAARAVTNISLPPAAMMANYDVVETNGIHITASQPVSVYGLDYDNAASAAFTGYPTPLLGTNYCVMARATLLSGRGPGLYSQLAIVATASNTTVKIRPSPAANLAGHATYYTNILQLGETYQINSRDDTANSETNDVTGTWITSDQPIAVFAGADIAYVPDRNTASGNPLVQEQLPVDSWGRQALALGFAGRTGGDSYRVLAATNNTVVLTNDVVAGTNQAGQFLDLIIAGPVEFKGSQPIQVAKFANGASFDGFGHTEGDPCEMLLPPTGHYLLTNIVCIPTGLDSGGNPYDLTNNYLNIIVTQSAITNTLVDGSHIASTNFVAISSSGYYGVRLTITNSGVHTVISSRPVGVEVYGFGTYDAYGYFGGIVK